MFSLISITKVCSKCSSYLKCFHPHHPLFDLFISMVAQTVKCLSTARETWVWSLGREDCWRRKWQPTSVLLPGKSHGQRSLGQATVHGVAKSWARLSEFTHSCVLVILYLFPLTWLSFRSWSFLIWILNRFHTAGFSHLSTSLKG